MGEAQERGDILYSWLIHIFVWREPTHYCKTIILQSKKKMKKKRKEKHSDQLQKRKKERKKERKRKHSEDVHV